MTTYYQTPVRDVLVVLVNSWWSDWLFLLAGYNIVLFFLSFVGRIVEKRIYKFLVVVNLLLIPLFLCLGFVVSIFFTSAP